MTGEFVRTLIGHGHYVEAVAFGSGLLASGSRDKTVKVWDPRTGDLLKTLSAHDGYVRSVVFGGSGLLASGSRDKTVKLWNAGG